MNIRSSYNSTGPNVKKEQGKYSAQGGGFINQNVNTFENPPDQINTAEIATKSKGIKQNSKRVTAVTRGVQSGTNARVNTFDNRGMQNPNHLQQHPVQHQGQAPHSVMNTNNPKIYDLQQQQMRQTNYNGQSDKQSSQQHPQKNRASYSGSQQQYDPQMINSYGQQPQKPIGKLSS